MIKQPPPWSDIYTILPDAESLLGSLLHLWRLRTPSTSNRTYCDISDFYKITNNLNRIERKRAGCIRTVCSCALLPLDATLLYKGHGIRSASSQVNSKFFQIPPIRCMYSLATSTSKHHLWLMMLLLGTCTSLGRFILSDIKPWNRAIWGARWDSNPRPRRLINLHTLPTELLALGKNLKHVKL